MAWSATLNLELRTSNLEPFGLIFRSTPEESPEYRVQGEPPWAEAENDQPGEEERKFGGINKFIRMSPDVQDRVAIRDPVSDRH